LKMMEREGKFNGDEVVKEAVSRAWKLIVPALSGYRPKLEVLSLSKHQGICLLAGQETPLVVAREAMERIKKKLGVQEEKSFSSGEEERIDSDYLLGVQTNYPTRGGKVVLTKRDVFRTSLEGKALAGEIWSVKNLEPMGWGEIFYHKGQEIFRRARGAIVGNEQYFQG